MARIAFLLSGGGLAFRAVVAAQEAGVLALSGIAAIADRDCSGLTYAAAHSVWHRLVDYSAFPARPAFDAALEAALAESRSDWAILNFNRLVAPSTVAQLGGRCLNLHLSLLPLFPGFGAVAAALAAGVRITGVTFHRVDASVDGGPIVAQAAVPVHPSDDAARLTRRLYQAAVPLQLQLCRHIAAGAALASASARSGEDMLSVPAIDADIAAFARTFLAGVFGGDQPGSGEDVGHDRQG